MSATLQEALNHGAHLLHSGRSAEAKALSDTLVGQVPDSVPVRLFAADATAASEGPAAAIAVLDGLPSPMRSDGRVMLQRSRLLFAGGRRAEALRQARDAQRQVSDDPQLMRLLATILRDCLEPEAAHEWLEKALALAPGDPAVLYDLAMTGYHLNRPEDAQAHLESLLESMPYHGAALHLRSALKAQTSTDNHVDDLRHRLSAGPGDPRFVAMASYALAKELEDLGRYEESVDALDSGARAYRETVRYDAEKELRAHEEIRSVFSGDVLTSLQPGYEAEAPIFVVGMPRTGTTLVERILSSHSQLVSIGEFTEFPRLYGQRLQRQFERNRARSSGEASLEIDFAELGSAYCDAARELAGNAPAFVDKLPFNFLYCGYIRAALPRARLIHLTRDPLDTCYAVYKTLFFGAYSFSYDLRELADYYVSYRRHMAHWHSVMPGAILDVSYEKLVAEPEAQMRRIFEWCDLPWEPAALDFYRQQDASMTASAMQVRQPMHLGSIGSWRRAEQALAPVRARFEAEGIL